MKNSIVVALVMGLLAACGNSEPPPPPEVPALIVQSQVAFYQADRKSLREAPKEPLRLWMPYVVGDIYGSPNAGELAPVTLNKDLSFRMNLNRASVFLEKSLVPTAFSTRWLKIEPANARIARLLPYVLPADNIQPLGRAEWLDESGRRYMLVYLDRPARVRGEVVYENRRLEYDIEATQAGYVWVQQPDDSGTYKAVPRPAKLTLGVTPE
jgi:hypothetical protein